jgi:hypothetical protein
MVLDILVEIAGYYFVIIMGNKSSRQRSGQYTPAIPHARYQCVPTREHEILPSVSHNMSYLMELVLLTKRNPNMHTEIRQYLAVYPEELNKENDKGWTALAIAVGNTNTCSCIETVQLLLTLGASVNHGKIKPIMVAAAYAGTSSTVETFFLLTEQPGLNYYTSYQQDDTTGIYEVLFFAAQSWSPNMKIIDHLIHQGCSIAHVSERIAILQRSAALKILDEIRQTGVNSPAIATLDAVFE